MQLVYIFKLPGKFLLLVIVGRICQIKLSFEENKNKACAEQSKTADKLYNNYWSQFRKEKEFRITNSMYNKTICPSGIQS